MTNVMAGNDAGWLLSFRDERAQGGKLRIGERPLLEVGRDEYDGEISATLPAGLEGGAYSFTIEGLSDDDYATIAAGRARVLQLYLYWREAVGGLGAAVSSLAGLTDLAGVVKSQQIPSALVATLRIESITRRAGGRRYETVVTARERAFDIVASSPLCTAIDKPVGDAVKELLGTHCGFDDFKWWGASPGPGAAAPAGKPANVVLEKGRTVAGLLAELGAKLEESSGRYGRGMFLIRNGRLHIGARPIPLEPGTPVELSLDNGLVEVQTLQPVPSDPTFDVCDGLKQGRRAPTRRQFQLTLKGRPDLKPGDVVRFEAPAAEAGNGSASAVTLYVATVDHRLGRTTGFVTTVTGIEVAGTSYWDSHSNPRRSAETQSAAGGSAETQAAQGVKQMVRELLGSQPSTEVGEVRSVTTKGMQEPPAQTETVWRGLVAGDGEPNQGRRLDIARPSPAPAPDIPYATPFAWGKCGLVLPRYPGTRVLLAHRDGRGEEAVDVGALWQSGHGPESEAGDFWLILPVGASTQAATDEKKAPSEHTGEVTQDLIDANGHRWIEAGELTIRVGPKTLKKAGTRPADPSDRDGLTIEHPDSKAKIQIKSDGTIRIEAAKKLELVGKDGISISAPGKQIDIAAEDVKVTVDNAMDVS